MEIMKGPFGEDIFFKKKPSRTFLKNKSTFFFVDAFFKNNDFFKDCENIKFLKAGESLKTMPLFEQNLNWLTKSGCNKKSTVAVVGGGSLGDSIGFLASVYLRGVDFVQVPTTWLAAVDSAVGGKTALNYQGSKNQIGTIFGPKEIYFFESLLASSSLASSEGEIIKTLVLNPSKKWAREIIKNWSKQKIKFKDLESFVKYKTQIVKKDPEDQKGVRAVLNLGHTLGHVFELKQKISHSDAVKKGLLFTLSWSFEKKLISEEYFKNLKDILQEELPVMKPDVVKRLLLRDKKLVSSNKMNFIFPTKKGALVKEIKIDDVVKEYQRQINAQVQNGF